MPEPEEDADYITWADAQELPSWIEVPPPAPIRTITYDSSPRAKKRIVISETGEKFWKVEDAYDAIDHKAFKLVFDPILWEKGLLDDGLGLRAPVVPNPEGGSVRLLIHHGVEDSTRLLRAHYRQWLELNDLYQASPNEWGLAYQWLEGHPAFWYWPDSKYQGDISMLVTEDGLHSLYVWVGQADEDKGKWSVQMEHGIATEDRLHHYHDLALDTVAWTFEDAYVILAQKVNKQYNIDGTSKKEINA